MSDLGVFATIDWAVMTLKQLEAFYGAATFESFAVAADRLFITQSSLSKRIADLEDDLSCELFDRSGKKSVLTESGELMVGYAREILKLAEVARSKLIQPSQVEMLSGVCKFGISELSATTWFPTFVEHLRYAFPLLALDPRVIPKRELERQVERGEIDFAIVAGPVANDALNCQLVSQIPLNLVTSPKQIVQQTVLSVDEFQEHQFLTHSPESGLAMVFNNWLATNNLKTRPVIVCNSLTVITTLTVAGLGTSLLPTHYVQPLVDQGLLIPISSVYSLPSLDYHLIWHRDDIRSLTRAMKEQVLSAIDFSIANPLWVKRSDYQPR